MWSGLSTGVVRGVLQLGHGCSLGGGTGDGGRSGDHNKREDVPPSHIFLAAAARSKY